jgi:hypothetical protein
MTVSLHNVTPEKVERIIARWRMGWSVARIASSFKGIPCAVVRAICAETGYRTDDLSHKPRGPSRKWTRQEIATLRQMLADGLKYAEIAQHLRRSADGVRQKADDLRAHEERAKQTTAQSLRRARPRKCLKCEQLFDSEGPHNRICEDCKRQDVYSGFAIYSTGFGRR